MARYQTSSLPAGGAVGNALVWNGTLWVPGPIDLADNDGVTGVLDPVHGGTGLSAIGTPAQVLRVNGAGTALEYATPTPQAAPWSWSWGLPNFGGQTSFWMQAFTWVGATLNVAYPTQTNSVVFFPKSGGTLKYIQASYASSNVPAQVVTFTVSINGVDQTSLAVALAAAAFANGQTFFDLVLPSAANNYTVEIHCTAPANPGSGATFPSRVTVGGFVNPP